MLSLVWRRDERRVGPAWLVSCDVNIIAAEDADVRNVLHKLFQFH